MDDYGELEEFSNGSKPRPAERSRKARRGWSAFENLSHVL